jgi:D-3-phosphoglycerate dehydrogenase
MKVIVVEECVYDRFVPLADMLPQADFITLHVPLTPKTNHLISKKEFALMKKGVLIIDCSRGGVIDQDALYEALLSGKVGGAAIDVFEEEPPKDKKLFALSNVIATPHIGAQTYEAQNRAGVQIANNVIDALEKLKLS